MPPELKPAYLVHGDDHGALATRRMNLRALAESLGDGASVEVLAGEDASPSAVAAALAAMTLTLGRRVLIVDGAERYRPKDVQQHLAGALAALSPETTVAFFAREESRSLAPPALHEAVRAAGGQVIAHSAVKPWELPGWVREQGARLGIELDSAACKALVAHVGDRQQRLLRELEKLALACGPGRIGEAQVEELAARSAERRAYALADALLEADPAAALRAYLELRARDEQLPGLLYLMARRMRDALAIAELLASGAPVAEAKKRLQPMPSRAADRLIASVRASSPAHLRAALVELSELELASRGGSLLPSARRALSGLEQDSAALCAIKGIAQAQPA